MCKDPIKSKAVQSTMTSIESTSVLATRPDRVVYVVKVIIALMLHKDRRRFVKIKDIVNGLSSKKRSVRRRELVWKPQE